MLVKRYVIRLVRNHSQNEQIYFKFMTSDTILKTTSLHPTEAKKFDTVEEAEEQVEKNLIYKMNYYKGFDFMPIIETTYIHINKRN